MIPTPQGPWGRGKNLEKWGHFKKSSSQLWNITQANTVYVWYALDMLYYNCKIQGPGVNCLASRGRANLATTQVTVKAHTYRPLVCESGLFVPKFDNYEIFLMSFSM